MTKRKMSIKELVDQLQKEQLLKKDMIVPASCLSMHGGRMAIINADGNLALQDMLISTGIAPHKEGEAAFIDLDVTDSCHDQIAGKMEIPRNYYQRLNVEENLPCLDYNVNHFLRTAEKNYFVRSFIDKDGGTGMMRAMLSDRFKVIDNYDVLMAALGAIKESGIEITIHNADITEQKMYVRFEAPHVVRNSPALLQKYRTPDSGNQDTGIMAGFILTNSETGHGGFSVQPRLIVRACSNGMVIQQDAFKKVHLGGKMEEYSEINWSEETAQKNMELIVSQTKDAVKTFMSEDYLGKIIARIEEKGAKQLEHPTDALKNVAREFSMSAEKEKSILDFFVKGADTTPFGITQAMTYYAHKVAGADEQFEMERVALAVVENAEKYDKPFTERKRGQKGFMSN